MLLSEPCFLEKVRMAGVAAFSLASWVKNVHDFQTVHLAQINAAAQLERRIKDNEGILNKLSWM